MRQIILASGSPRRRELVAGMGIPFDAVASDYDEQLDDHRPVADVAKELALGKALDVAERYPDAIVIGSDVIMTLHGRQLGKQPDKETARILLREMSGQVVEVYCAVALVCRQTGLRDIEVTRGAIVYAPYDDAAIDRFLATDEWQDKAGATSVQSVSSPPVDHIQGDYDTILGINTKMLAQMLRRQGVVAHPASPEPIVPQKPFALQS